MTREEKETESDKINSWSMDNVVQRSTCNVVHLPPTFHPSWFMTVQRDRGPMGANPKNHGQTGYISHESPSHLIPSEKEHIYPSQETTSL